MSVHYESPHAWATSVDPAYEALSRAIVAASPISLVERSIVDLGAGTGATSRALQAAHSRPIALDLSVSMLAHGQASRPPAVAGDMTTLPLATASVGGAVAAFALSHVEDPGAVLAEARRVTEPGGPVIVGGFAATGSRHPAKDIVEDEAARRGWAPSGWYVHLKQDLEPRVTDRQSLVQLATDAGLAVVDLRDEDVDTGLDTAEALVGWRLSGPGLAPFIAGLPSEDRDELAAAAVAAVAALGSAVQRLRLGVRILSSIVPATR
ncbi:MAG TPA: class I SAM-dependent methyltransferase [Acidimicrobiales bacterium]|nr:class I SAM-dependent methyltransferase [Acidimicrobiales bacterium]